MNEVPRPNGSARGAHTAVISAPSKRHEYDRETGERSRFVSGYSNSTLPNIWS